MSGEFNGTEEIIDDILFYLQTAVFMISVIISFIYPVVIKNQTIIPLPSVPDRLENVETSLNDNRGFIAFYDWLEKNDEENIKLLK